jgi:hypothetical protein
MVTAQAPRQAIGESADEAIATVLRAEVEAREAILQSQFEAGHIAEAARADTRALHERTERRIRTLVAAFERERAARVTALDAQAAAAARPHVPSADELAALAQAVRALARELTGGAP